MKMNMKMIPLLGIFLVLAITTNALNECKGTIKSDESPCIVVVPVNTSATACTSLTAQFYVNGSQNLYNQTMHEFSPFACNATFNQSSPATYPIFFTNGDSASIIVEENVDNLFYLYLVGLLVMFSLIGLGYYVEDKTFTIVGGMLSCIMALHLFSQGFPGLTDSFLRQGIIILLAGIGFYFIIAPSLDYIINQGARQ